MADADVRPVESGAPQGTVRVNAPAVVAELVDDEVILINLETGTYYTLGGAGVDAWPSIEDGVTVDEVVALVQAAYPTTPPDKVAEAITGLIGALAAENLVSVTADPGERGGARTATPVERPFVAPTFERYVDMQQLIQLDPILEVDERGWPVDGQS